MKIFGRKPLKQAAGELSEIGVEPGGMSDVLGLAAARIGEIVQAAGRAKEEIGAGLAAQAPAAGTKLTPRDELAAELARSLVGRTEQLAGEAEELATVLGRASAQLAAAPPQPAPSPQTPPQGAGPAPEPAITTVSPAEPATPAPRPFSKASGSMPPPAPPAPVVPVEEVPAAPSAATTVEEELPYEPETDAEIVATLAETTQPQSGLQRRVTERFSAADEGDQKPRFKRRETTGSLLDAGPAYSAEGVRLLATQMAVAGSSREEIEARLLDEFGVEDADELLTDVLNVRKSGGRSATG